MSKSDSTKPKRTEQFTNYGFILAAIGSSVGLGNIWKFPYITGKYGGAAFFLLFIICLVLIGLPVLLAEMTIGRGGRSNASTSLLRLSGSKTWGRLGLLAVAGPFIILSYYAVVAGWTLHYAMLSFSGRLFSGESYGARFDSFIGGFSPLIWQFVVMFVVGFVIAKGIAAGIERYNRILIPGMVVLLLLLVVRVLLLEGAGEGVAFFLEPDFSRLTPQSFLIALGHAFFSLSLGMGVLMTYGAYVDKKQSLGTATLAIGLGDLLYALLAGLIIFPTTFAFGLEPSQGPGLVFVALPAAFSAMPLGSLFGGLFFVLLAVAAITSAFSILEVPVAWAMDKYGWSRVRSSVIVSTLCFLLGVPSVLSVGGAVDGLGFGGRSFFDWMDFISSNILLPLCGMIVTLFVGYVWKGAAEEAGINKGWLKLWLFMLRYVVPLLVLLVLLSTSGMLSLGE